MSTDMPREPLRILVVDDSDDDIVLLTEALREEPGVELLPAARSGDDALAYLRREGAHGDSERPGLLLLDINMPGKTGFEVLSALKTDPLLRSIPVVILSTSGLDSDVARAYDCGASSYITKPGTYDVLRSMAHSLVEYWSQVVRVPPA